MKIREEQMNTLDEASQEDFHQRLLFFLREELPEETSEFTDEGLMDWIIENEKRALKYDVETELGITQFVCLTFLVGPKFDELPDVHAYLKEPNTDPDEKMDILADEFLAALDEGGSD